MIEYFSSPGNILGAIAIVILGVFSTLNLLDKRRVAKNEVEKQSEDRLNGILKETVDSLEKKVKTLEDQERELQAAVNKLSGENNIMREILQGRDKDTQKKNELLFEMVKSTNDHVRNLYELLVAQHQTQPLNGQ